MPNLGNVENAYLALGLFVPGLIILFVRSQFITGRRSNRADVALLYMAVSVFYYGVSLPAIHLIPASDDGAALRIVGWLLLIFVGPVLVGLLLGFSAQNEWSRRILQKVGMNPVHEIPTAWDWKFSAMPPSWVLVTLKDGTRFAGYCGLNSFMSSDPTERDIYIEWVYDIDDHNQWTSAGEKGVFIAPGEIRTIEFWPANVKEIT